MISPLESRVLDANSENLGIAVDELMKNAGRELAEVLAGTFVNGEKLLFVCGAGNNGGDGYAAANQIEGRSVTVAYFSEPKTKAARKQFSKLQNAPVKFKNIDLNDYDVIVDCVLGTGTHGDVQEPYASYIDAVNKSKKTVVACDIPSGFGTSKAIRPDVTVTFHDMKTGMNHRNCGTIIIADIGIPAEASGQVGPGDLLRYPVPKSGSHKGQNGRLLIVGGGPYTGAPALAAMAALRVGIDLVRIAAPENAAGIIASYSPSFILSSLPGDHLTNESVEEILNMSEEADAVLIGPGLGSDSETADAVSAIVRNCTKPTVIDADGINALAGRKFSHKAPIVFTPHSMELSRLTGKKDADGEDASKFAAKHRCVILLKGATDLIFDGKKMRSNVTGTPAMTVGGTGDVLAGAVSGLISKGMPCFDAACLAAYLCGKAGERAFDEYSYGLTAPDVAKDIAKVLRDELK
jgi:hydroxyethylthiazole kinase-like uncharacterized protein yjeF